MSTSEFGGDPFQLVTVAVGLGIMKFGIEGTMRRAERWVSRQGMAAAHPSTGFPSPQ